MRLIPHCPVCDCINLNGKELCTSCQDVLDKELFDNYMVRCPVCSMPLVSYDYVCPRCGYSKYENPELKADVLKVTSLAPYFASTSRRVLEQFKFGKDKSLARPIARIYLEAVRKMGIEDCIVVPVPCSRKSLEARGWDQMVEVARCMEKLCSEYGIRCRNVEMLENRGRVFSQQKNLTKAQRIESSKGKYALTSRLSKTRLENLKGSRIMIVDDIHTTGATINACSKVMKDSGYTNVEAMTWLMEL